MYNVEIVDPESGVNTVIQQTRQSLALITQVSNVNWQVNTRVSKASRPDKITWVSISSVRVGKWQVSAKTVYHQYASVFILNSSIHTHTVEFIL